MVCCFSFSVLSLSLRLTNGYGLPCVAGLVVGCGGCAAVAKQFAYWMVVNYREAYGMFAVNGVLFNHESPRRGMCGRSMLSGFALLCSALLCSAYASVYVFARVKC